MHRSASPETPALFELSVFALLSAAILGGGAAWSLIDAALAVFATWVLAWSFVRQGSGACAPWRRLEWGAMAIVLGLALTQSIPLPWTWWTALTHRHDIARDLSTAGVAPQWHALSLDPLGLARRLGASLPGVAIIVGARGCSSRSLRRMAVALVVLAFASVLLGLAQVADGPESALRLHDFHNRVGALGWFSYRNAEASFLLMALPMTFGLLVGLDPRRGEAGAVYRAGLLLAVPLLLLGLALTYSRAGLLLGAVELAGCAALVLRSRAVADMPRASLMLVAVACAAGFLLVAYFAWPGLTLRQSETVLGDARWRLYSTLAQYAAGYAPWGAGWGSFEQVFQDAPQNRELMLAYYNHGHNDWLQLPLELGWLFLPIIGAVLTVVCAATWKVWTRPDAEPGRGLTILARAASLSLLIAMIHSYFDYSLHNGANLAVFAFLAAVLLGSGYPARPEGATSSTPKASSESTGSVATAAGYNALPEK